MTAPIHCRIERLTPRLRERYLAFFEHERGPAFADNPEPPLPVAAHDAAPGAIAATDHYHGTLSMFTAAGFVELMRHEDLTVVRRMLR